MFRRINLVRWLTSVLALGATQSGAVLGLSGGGKHVIVETSTVGYVGDRTNLAYDIGDSVVTRTIDRYLGVRYAQPPVGRLRFQPPEPLTDGLETGKKRYQRMNATRPGSPCIQVSYYNETERDLQSEDCLFLNIYSPYEVNDKDKLYPVMVYIHGGSYEEGTGIRYDGTTLAMHGVVVVTINYRLGVLGFLTVGDDRLAGNWGLLDQIEALSWVSKNIRSFRGDSSRTTLFGSSSGAASIGLLITSPKANGLFHAAILQSGSPLAFWATYSPAYLYDSLESFTKKLAISANCASTSTTEQQIECLRTIDPHHFTDLHFKFEPIVPSHFNFKPRIDGTLLPDAPEVMYREGRYQSIPVMLGVVEDEWARSLHWFVTDMDDTEIDDTNFEDGFDRQSFEQAVRHVITKRFRWPMAVADATILEYTRWTKMDNALVNRQMFKEFMSDLTIVSSTVQLSDYLSSRNPANRNHSHGSHAYRSHVHTGHAHRGHAHRGSTPGVFLYRYNYHPVNPPTAPPLQHSPDDSEMPSWWGVYHAIELDMVFGSPFTGYHLMGSRGRDWTDEDRAMSRTMMKLWTNFAKNLNPNSAYDGRRQFIWKPTQPIQTDYLYITGADLNNASMRRNLRTAETTFWNHLVPRLVELGNSPHVLTTPNNAKLSTTQIDFKGEDKTDANRDDLRKREQIITNYTWVSARDVVSFGSDPPGGRTKSLGYRDQEDEQSDSEPDEVDVDPVMEASLNIVHSMEDSSSTAALYKTLALGLMACTVVLMLVTCFLACKYNELKRRRMINASSVFVHTVPSTIESNNEKNHVTNNITGMI